MTENTDGDAWEWTQVLAELASFARDRELNPPLVIAVSGDAPHALDVTVAGSDYETWAIALLEDVCPRGVRLPEVARASIGEPAGPGGIRVGRTWGTLPRTDTHVALTAYLDPILTGRAS